MSNETPSIKATLYTDGGCRNHSSGKGFAGWGYHGQIGDYVYDGWGSIEELTTNNDFAELPRSLIQKTKWSETHYTRLRDYEGMHIKEARGFLKTLHLAFH